MAGAALFFFFFFFFCLWCGVVCSARNELWEMGGWMDGWDGMGWDGGGWE